MVKSPGVTTLSGLCLRGPSEMHKSPHKSELPIEKEMAQAQPHGGGEGIVTLILVSPPSRSSGSLLGLLRTFASPPTPQDSPFSQNRQPPLHSTHRSRSP